MKRPRTLLSDEVVTLHPKCKGGKGHCLPRVPPICLNLLLGLHFPEQPQKGTEGSLSRHRLPWVRAFQGDGLPSVLERSPGCNPRPRDISASVTGHPRVWGQQPRKPPKSRLAPGVPGITASQAGHAATGGLAGTKSSLSRPCRGNRAPASRPWGHVLHRLTHTTNKFSSICTKHAAAAAPLLETRPTISTKAFGGRTQGPKKFFFLFFFLFFFNGLRRNTKNYFSIAAENAHGLTETIKGRAVAHAWTRTVTEGD